MSNLNIKFNNKSYSIPSASLAPATARLEAHLRSMMDTLVEIDIFPEDRITDFVQDTEDFGGLFVAMRVCDVVLNVGDTYYVEWDGETYPCVAKADVLAGELPCIYLGNGLLFGQPSDEPFAIGQFTHATDLGMFAFEGTEHTVRIYQKSNGVERLEGDGQEFHTMAPSTLSFRSTAPLDELKEVRIDGVAVDPANYTLTEGSTIVTFPIDYLKDFGKGKYEVTVESENNSASGEFTVVQPELNEYGFYYNKPYIAYVDMYEARHAFMLSEDGVVRFRNLLGGYTSEGTYTITGNTFTVYLPDDQVFTGEIRSDGFYCNEIDTLFTLNLDQVAADEDYIYIRNDGSTGYGAMVIDTTKTAYGPVKTNINDYPVGLYWLAYGRCENLRSIVLPEGLASFGESAFFDCVNLVSATLPEGPTSTGNETFYRCKKLLGVNIPDSVTRIGSHAFCFCESLETITIPAGVTVIYNSAFGECTNLTNITFKGTMAQWNAIEKHEDWNYNVPATHVHCSDGDVAL